MKRISFLTFRTCFWLTSSSCAAFTMYKTPTSYGKHRCDGWWGFMRHASSTCIHACVSMYVSMYVCICVWMYVWHVCMHVLQSSCIHNCKSCGREQTDMSFWCLSVLHVRICVNPGQTQYELLMPLAHVWNCVNSDQTLVKLGNSDVCGARGSRACGVLLGRAVYREDEPVVLLHRTSDMLRSDDGACAWWFHMYVCRMYVLGCMFHKHMPGYMCDMYVLGCVCV